MLPPGLKELAVIKDLNAAAASADKEGLCAGDFCKHGPCRSPLEVRCLRSKDKRSLIPDVKTAVGVYVTHLDMDMVR